MLCTLFVSIAQGEIASRATLQVLEFSRHGARAPSKLEYAEKLSKDGQQPFTKKSQLTDYGLRQHFEIGKQLIRKFHQPEDKTKRNFLTKTYDLEKVYVQSTDSKRTY